MRNSPVNLMTDQRALRASGILLLGTAMGVAEAARTALLTALERDPRNQDAVELVSEICGLPAVRFVPRLDEPGALGELASACEGDG